MSGCSNVNSFHFTRRSFQEIVQYEVELSNCLMKINDKKALVICWSGVFFTSDEATLFLLLDWKYHLKLYSWIMCFLPEEEQLAIHENLDDLDPLCFNPMKVSK
jgi:hypothetical protein